MIIHSLVFVVALCKYWLVYVVWASWKILNLRLPFFCFNSECLSIFDSLNFHSYDPISSKSTQKNSNHWYDSPFVSKWRVLHSNLFCFIFIRLCRYFWPAVGNPQPISDSAQKKNEFHRGRSREIQGNVESEILIPIRRKICTKKNRFAFDRGPIPHRSLPPRFVTETTRSIWSNKNYMVSMFALFFVCSSDLLSQIHMRSLYLWPFFHIIYRVNNWFAWNRPNSLPLPSTIT